MRTLLLLAMVSGCAAQGRYTATRTSFGRAPEEPLTSAIDTARTQHYELAAIDATRDTFVALPAEQPSPDVQSAMFVRVRVFAAGGFVRHGAAGTHPRALGARTVVTVTPLAYRDGRVLPPDEVPEPVRKRADDLSWAILSAVRP